jgi:hypothetical protein
MVTAPEVKIVCHPRVNEIMKKKEMEKYLGNPELITSDEATAFGEDVAKWNRDIESLLKSQLDLTTSTSLH